MDKKKLNIAFLIAWIVIVAAGTILMFTGITHESLWYDESYTAAIINHPIPDIINITAGDSHPPLYYLMLHLFSLVFGSSVFALRAFSALGAAALAALGIGPVRRALGNRFGLIYTVLTFALPITLSMAQEARMYTWAAFFVTGSALWGYLAYKESRVKDWIIFGICTLAAAYTHYYALLAELIICILLFVFMLTGKKKIVPFLCTAGAAAAGYVPWLFVLTAQAGRIGSDYWISPVTGEVIKKVMVYPFSNKFSYYWSPLFVDIAFYVSAALILFGLIYRIVRRDENAKMAILAAVAFILTIGAGIAASFIIRPVLVERYMVPVLGLFILALSCGIGALGKRVLPVIGCAVIIAFSVPQTNYTISNRFNGPMIEAEERLEPLLQPGDVFLHTDEHTIGTFCYYFPDNMNYYYKGKESKAYSNFDAFKPNGLVIDSLDEIGNDKRIWLVQRFGAPDAVTAGSWFSTGILKREGGPMVFRVNPSWYGFTVYRVTAGGKSATTVKTGAESSGSLTVKVSGLKNDTGKALISIFQQSPENNIAQTTSGIEGGNAEAVFKDLLFGEYAIVVFDDENGNQQIDMTGDIPNEGIGYSNTPEAPQGPPDYEKCKFMFNADGAVISVPVFYYDAP